MLAPLIDILPDAVRESFSALQARNARAVGDDLDGQGRLARQGIAILVVPGLPVPVSVCPCCASPSLETHTVLEGMASRRVCRACGASGALGAW